LKSPLRAAKQERRKEGKRKFSCFRGRLLTSKEEEEEEEIEEGVRSHVRTVSRNKEQGGE
jgi:hypothetical protein